MPFMCQATLAVEGGAQKAPGPQEGSAGPLTLQGSLSGEQSGQPCSCPRADPCSTHHDDGDPGGRAVLFGERVIKVLFEFTCYFSLHIILLGGVILQKRGKDTDPESHSTLSLPRQSHTTHRSHRLLLMGRLSHEMREPCESSN